MSGYKGWQGWHGRWPERVADAVTFDASPGRHTAMVGAIDVVIERRGKAWLTRIWPDGEHRGKLQLPADAPLSEHWADMQPGAWIGQDRTLREAKARARQGLASILSGDSAHEMTVWGAR